MCIVYGRYSVNTGHYTSVHTSYFSTHFILQYRHCGASLREYSRLVKVEIK